ncbi:MAG: gamma-glutamylcyclotransferase family protein, partial [Patescibacteria group bacterium]
RGGIFSEKCVRTNSRILHIIPMTLFAYGTLKEPSILRRLIGRVPEMKPAVLRGFRLVRPPFRRWKMYFMAVPSRGSIVRGKLISGLVKNDMVKIAEWEDVPEKVWIRGRVVASVGGRPIKTFAYLGSKKISTRSAE